MRLIIDILYKLLMRGDLFMKVLRGKVVSGSSHSSKWMEKLDRKYSSKTGVNIIPGTLNIQLEDRVQLQPEVTDSCSNVLCYLNGERVFLVKSNKKNKNNPTLIEIATFNKIKDSLGLNDGDEVRITLLESV
jgi:CTP-dependent riboflavin kinase